MRPVLFYVLDFPVYSYSIFAVLAYLAALGYGWVAAGRLGLDRVHVIDISLYLFVGGIIGARLLFVIVDHQRFVKNPLDILKIWKGGLVYYGGFAGAWAAGSWFAIRRKLDYWLWADLVAPSAMIALAIGRIGCFMNGCCYGKVSPDLPWGVVYPPSHPALGLHQYPVHPTPLYESLATALIFIALMILWRRKSFKGELFWAAVIMYSAARFVIEYFRGDPRGRVLMFSTSQFIAILAAAVSVFALALLYHRARPPTKDAS